MAAPDAPPSGTRDVLARIDRVGFQRWAALLLVADLVALVAVILRVGASTALPLLIFQVAIVPPLWSALVWSLRTRLGLPDRWVAPITAIGVAGGILGGLDALVVIASADVGHLLNVAALVCQAVWFLAFGAGTRAARTFIDQTPTLASVTGIGLVAFAISGILLSGQLLAAVQTVASVFAVAEYVWLFRLARTPQPTAASWA